MTILNQTMKAAAVALALGGTTLSAMPAGAAPFDNNRHNNSRPNLDFSFSIGNGDFRFGVGNDRHRHRGDRFCMSDRAVRADLRSDGYRDIRFFDRRGRVVQVTAELGRRDFRIAYDTCRGYIIDRDRIG